MGRQAQSSEGGGRGMPRPGPLSVGTSRPFSRRKLLVHPSRRLIPSADPESVSARRLANRSEHEEVHHVGVGISIHRRSGQAERIR